MEHRAFKDRISPSSSRLYLYVIVRRMGLFTVGFNLAVEMLLSPVRLVVIFTRRGQLTILCSLGSNMPLGVIWVVLFRS